MTSNAPTVNYLKDYQVPQFEIDSVYLEFDLKPSETVVTNTMRVRSKSGAQVLELAGEQLLLISVKIDDEDVLAKCEVSDDTLTIPAGLPEFKLEIVTEVSPQQNTSLEGLYRTSGNYCTQCEAEGFRKITYFLDRPDVLTFYTTKIIADKKDNAVLLSNGNLIESGDLEGDRHYAIWQDPYKKPCYLFALVAGNLAFIEDVFTTADQRDVVLRIYVEARNIDNCEHAMESLKKSMKWDEERFGLIYDLDIYMIVAVDDFNMGAMENKGLNVFNSKFVLANPDTATDVDYEGIEAVIGHEYFHNWTGNRVTCRDWFQLTLKEGLTVFRDQEFTADMLSPAVKRIEDVKKVRNNQFPEDAGPMAHPIQPQSYIEMNNFYTMTVYEKGAEVVRLYHTLLGEAGFQKGMKLYFERHDGDAVTVEDFRNAMADANDVDLSQMHNWYIQSGTPTLKVSECFDANQETYSLTFTQSLPAQAEPFKPLLLPIKLGLLSETGEALSLNVIADGARVDIENQQALFWMTKQTQTLTFNDLKSKPIPSLFRGFSAPVYLEFDYSDEALSLLTQADQDSFNRWEAFQTLALNEIKANIQRFESNEALTLSDPLKAAFKGVMEDKQADQALIALTITLPSLTYIGEQYEIVNVDAIYHVHHWLREQLATVNASALLSLYHVLNERTSIYQYHKADIAQRMLKNACLSYLSLIPQNNELVKKQFEAQANMTDVLAALQSIANSEHPDRSTCLQDFYNKWQADPLVLDKWFALQASSHHERTLEDVKALVQHKDFAYENPNRVRSVLGVFGRMNLLGFHRADGAGYAFLADEVMKVDCLNPQVAARIVTPFTHWQRYDLARQVQMKAALQTILAMDGLSKDVYEIVTKSLAVGSH